MIVKLKHIFLVIIVLFAANAMAQWDTTWIKTYGGNRDDKAFDIIQTQDNGFLVIGSTSSFGFDNSQMYFLKLDSTGAIMWSKSHGGSGQESGQSVIETSDGGFFGVGYTNSWGSGGFDFFMVKLDVNGNLEYEDYYGGSDWDFAWDVIEVAPEEFVIAGETQSYGAGNADGWIVKFNGKTRQFVWDKTVGTSNYENYKAVAPGENGSFVAAGKGTQLGRTDEDVLVTRFDSLGDTIWTKYYGDTLQDYANDVIWMSDSTYALTGLKTIANIKNILVLKISKSSNTIFDNYWGTSTNRVGSGITEIDSLKISITGTLEVYDQNTDFFLAYSYPNSKYFKGGSTQGGLKNDISIGLINLQDTGYIIAGYSDGFNSSYTDILLFKTFKTGRYDGAKFTYHQDVSNILSEEKISQPSNKITYNTNRNILSFYGMTTKNRIEIYDIKGVQKATLTTTAQEINLSSLNLNSGIYILRVNNESKVYTTTYFQP
tara:strand:+ start:102175 stop:103635 length:1461 start_codon:yes stop_codon:yes gene_type:complete